jgi:hypothetical protein
LGLTKKKQAAGNFPYSLFVLEIMTRRELANMMPDDIRIFLNTYRILETPNIYSEKIVFRPKPDCMYRG